jgi:hypothetical protein
LRGGRATRLRGGRATRLRGGRANTYNEDMRETRRSRIQLFGFRIAMMAGAATALLAVAAAAVGGGCAGDVHNLPPGGDGATVKDSGAHAEGGGPHDTKPPPGKEAAVQPDKGQPDPCAKYKKAGQSCAGGQSCPSGTTPATLGSKPCTCYVPCNPDVSKSCSPLECGKICLQLVDSTGKALKGQGVCDDDPGQAEGEPCSPKVCRLGLACTAFTSSVAYCRKKCSLPADCPAFKMVCVALSSSTKKVCVPGGSTTGPKEGQSCAGANDFCQQGLICDPQTKICYKACDPSKSTCGSKTCTKLVDPGPKVTVGYGCK